MQAVLRWGTTVVVGAMLGLVPTLGQEALQVYFVDVEGGQATLIVAPSGQSLLIDSGFPGERDAGRIAAAATDAGLEQIDYHMVTHLHGDHMGSTPVLVTKIPILNYVDGGMPIDPSGNAYQAYASARESGHHIVARPGPETESRSTVSTCRSSPRTARRWRSRCLARVSRTRSAATSRRCRLTKARMRARSGW